MCNPIPSNTKKFGIKLMKKERLEARITSLVESNKLKAFNKHWTKIQSYARDDSNYEILDDGERVFVVPKKYKDIYNYLAELRRKDTDDWRLKFLRDAGMNMDKYEEAREKRKQDNAQDSKESSPVIGMMRTLSYDSLTTLEGSERMTYNNDEYNVISYIM